MLWEFDWRWEWGQAMRMIQDSNLKKRIGPQSGNFSDYDAPTCDGRSFRGSPYGTSKDYFWGLPFLGKTVSEVAIGTVAVELKLRGTSAPVSRVQRPVAVFGAGDRFVAGAYDDECAPERRFGKAVYIVDMQTGNILRRFVDYEESSGTFRKFDAPITGSPALFDEFTGNLASRGFIGDSQGRLFRIDMSDPDPLRWRLTLFYAPGPRLDPDTGAPVGADLDPRA